ncbi:hypothetical protein [Streptomyces sp. HPF1205]|uniref:hypothetical protein n=1 Tax=Streptomyces sp. HPF1205 TaxID=2873262 RepID=UPI001CED5646|nr:hypothetical protein [Streptomyces sp. HPF1205]
MARARFIALTTAIVVLGGGAAAIVEVSQGGGGGHGGRAGGGPVDPARLQSDIAAKLPAGWTDTVDRSGDTVNVRLVHEGGTKELLAAIHAHKIVDPDEPEMMRLLPADLSDTGYLIHYSDTKDKGTLLRVAAGKGHPGPHPVLVFASREFIAAELAQAPPFTPTAVVVPLP